jgi:hypothetical protein
MDHNYLEPMVADQGQGWVDKWIVYGLVDGKQLFTARELTLDPGAKCTLKDPGASGWITVQGKGRMGKLNLQTPAMIRFGAETEDEVFISHEAATRGVTIENTGSESVSAILAPTHSAKSRTSATTRRSKPAAAGDRSVVSARCRWRLSLFDATGGMKVSRVARSVQARPIRATR